MTYLDYKIYLFPFVMLSSFFVQCKAEYSYAQQCNYTMTMVQNATVRCSGQIIFEENFNGESLDLKKWTIERRIPQGPDYEFNMYLDDVGSVLQMRRGKLILKPEVTDYIYHDASLRNHFSLGPNCTGRLNTNECVFQRVGSDRINPLITAQIKTKNKFSFKYGRVEIRAKLPGAMWVFPQLWLEPSENFYGDVNYASGQMRVAHTIANGDDIILKGGLILNAVEPWRSLKMCQHRKKTLRLGQGYHIYELIWHPSVILVAVDGDVYCRIEIKSKKAEFKNIVKSGENLPNKEKLDVGGVWAPFDREFHLTLGYGVAGWRGFKDDSEWKVHKPWLNYNPLSKIWFWMKESDNINWLNYGDMRIDYVRVYAI